MAAAVDPGVYRGLCPAVADGLDLQNAVRNLHQPTTAGKQLCLEVRAQAEAHHRQIVGVHDLPELVDLLAGEELALVHNNHIHLSQLLRLKPAENIRFR